MQLTDDLHIHERLAAYVLWECMQIAHGRAQENLITSSNRLTFKRLRAGMRTGAHSTREPAKVRLAKKRRGKLSGRYSGKRRGHAPAVGQADCLRMRAFFSATYSVSVSGSG
jgi:hypothetical protein